MSDSAPPTDALGRQTEFKMSIQGGMLEALGINMYTTLGKCLVEFIANSYDSDATEVHVDFPVRRIAESRKQVRQAAKKRLAAAGRIRDRFDILLEPLPSEITVLVSDDGHGMNWEEVRDKFLPLNRKRREDCRSGEASNKSESGKRFVMGRKGLGKLAGFGAAEKVEVRTKRAGETFATIVTLDDRVLKTSQNVTDVSIEATYDDGLDPGEHGTRITLSGLKADAVKEREDTIEGVILEAFNAVRPDDLAIVLNGRQLKPKPRDYEFTYPNARDSRGYASETVIIEDIGDIPINYFVGFTKRGANINARQRGARIYCNNRLAAGPSLFGLPTGMHSFHSTDYLECVVEADALDRESVDLINTNRTQLREDNEVVRCVLAKITEIMREAVKAHAKFTEERADEDLQKDPQGRVLNELVSNLPAKTRVPAGKLLKAIAVKVGVGTPEFEELAPAFMNSVNATEVLLKLIKLRTEPETIARVARHLRELGEMEKADVLKLYRGRRNGISALRVLVERGEKEEWRKVGREKELHSLLKECPWLIRPEFSNYITSDSNLNVVASKIAEQLGLDTFAPIWDGNEKDETRPDLVFLMSDIPFGPHVVNVVELKSPTLPLKIDHLQQLERYMFQVTTWCRSHVSNVVSVRGFLVGAMPKQNATAVDQLQLREKYEQQGTIAGIRILGLQEMINDAWTVHGGAIRALEAELAGQAPEPPAESENEAWMEGNEEAEDRDRAGAAEGGGSDGEPVNAVPV